MMNEYRVMGRRQFLTGAATLAGGLVAVGCVQRNATQSSATETSAQLTSAKGSTASEVPVASSRPALGPGANLGGRRLFPADNPWNQNIASEPVDPNSATLIASIGLDKNLHPDYGTVYQGKPVGIPYVVVPGDQPRVPIRFVADGDESDPGPYPVPPGAPVEDGPDSTGDRHVVVLDRDNWRLYELVAAYPEAGGWRADAGAIFDLDSNQFRPAGWTSANAAGLAILPGLVRYDEVVEVGAIRHAVAFTCLRTRRAYVHPARHFASRNSDPNLPPMGMRVRLKADYDISSFPACARVILTALKEYGMLLAQNGSDWYMNGAPDPRWNTRELSTLKRVKGRDLEVVRMGPVVTR
jgi:hypothetical protein